MEPHLVVAAGLVDGLRGRGMILAPYPEGVPEHLIYLGGPEKGMAVKLQSARRPLNELFNRHSPTTLHIVLLSIIYANALPGHPLPEGRLNLRPTVVCAEGWPAVVTPDRLSNVDLPLLLLSTFSWALPFEKPSLTLIF